MRFIRCKECGYIDSESHWTAYKVGVDGRNTVKHWEADRKNWLPCDGCQEDQKFEIIEASIDVIESEMREMRDYVSGVKAPEALWGDDVYALKDRAGRIMRLIKGLEPSASASQVFLVKQNVLSILYFINREIKQNKAARLGALELDEIEMLLNEAIDTCMLIMRKGAGQ